MIASSPAFGRTITPRCARANRTDAIAHHPVVVTRLEAMGFHSLDQLADGDPTDILSQGASLTGSSCWKNSPQAKAAVQGAIQAAIAHISRGSP